MTVPELQSVCREESVDASLATSMTPADYAVSMRKDLLQHFSRYAGEGEGEEGGEFEEGGAGAE